MSTDRLTTDKNDIEENAQANAQANAAFSYTYSAPTEEERKQAEDIRRRYAPDCEKQPTSAIAELNRLDGKVKMLSNAFGIGLGLFGTLVFGLGLSMLLEFSIIGGGVVVSVIGAAIAAATYPLYKIVHARLKRKYASEILNLTQKILGDANPKA